MATTRFSLAITCAAVSLLFSSCGVIPSLISASQSSQHPDSTPSASTSASATPAPAAARSTYPAQQPTTTPAPTAATPSTAQGTSTLPPAPVAPDNINEFSTEGLTSFISFWEEAHNYAMLSGDISLVQPLVSAENTALHDEYTLTQGIYQAGGYLEGTRTTVEVLPGEMADVGSGAYGVAVEYSFTPGVTHYEGRRLLTSEPAVEQKTMVAVAEHDGERWQLVTFIDPEQQ